jgi:glycosidase
MNSVIYSILPRMFTAWRHDDKLQNGTFLKAMSLLPYLKKMNVDIIYLLPVFEHSNSYKKGEIGSPYSIKNIYNLDRNLHDDLLGENDNSMIEIEFKAFVEACHLLGMKVMVDFVFRTVARDSDLIVEHPEWFYWIDLKFKESFCAPQLETFKKPTVVSEKAVPGIYKSKSICKYLSQFSLPPNELDSGKWEHLLKRHAKTGENILEIIEEEYGLTTAPGFADVINDPQPPWSDVTYLKFYFDTHKEAKRYLDKNQPPYILHDIAKLNLFRGELCNTALWKYTVDVIPYYQREFGIDGARIDMGHALPPDLNREIIEKSKGINENFLLLVGEFNCKIQRRPERRIHFMTGSIVV